MSLATCKTLEEAWADFRQNIEDASVADRSDDQWRNWRMIFFSGAYAFAVMLDKIYFDNRGNEDESTRIARELFNEITAFFTELEKSE